MIKFKTIKLKLITKTIRFLALKTTIGFLFYLIKIDVFTKLKHIFKFIFYFRLNIKKTKFFKLVLKENCVVVKVCKVK